eukprot:TRINITY_DN15301_c0_g2_i1.p1 TRINITY_DN15301_c0_g2~~TRINITY_DN15301_c0_g2_i1.p1  ORF type:complete len:843 (+),score=133.46 TRINITY_DN15301_c0_g2_i1:302-2530(+)
MQAESSFKFLAHVTNNLRHNSLQLDDGESVRLLNRIIGVLWPRLDKALDKLMRNTVAPLLRDMLGMSSLAFDTWTVGKSIPKIGSVRFYEDSHGFRLILPLTYLSDSDVNLSVMRGVTLGISEIGLEGDLTLAFGPLLDDFPLMGGLLIYFVDAPTLTLSFTGIGNIANLPGIDSRVQSAVESALGDVLVYPNCIDVPFGELRDLGIDEITFRQPHPTGVLRVRVISASGLQAGDVSFLGCRSSDPYVWIAMEPSSTNTWRSSTVTQNLSPRWTSADVHDFLVFDREQILRISVYDEDNVGADDLIGEAAPMMVSTAVATSGQPLSLTPSGLLYLEFLWMDLVEKGEEILPPERCDGAIRGCNTKPFGRIARDYVVEVTIHQVKLPDALGTGVFVSGTIGGQRETTPLTTFTPVEKQRDRRLLREVATRCVAHGMDVATISAVTALPVEDVREVAREVLNNAQKSVTARQSAVLSTGEAVPALGIEYLDIVVNRRLFFIIGADDVESATMQLCVLNQDKDELFDRDIEVTLKDCLATDEQSKRHALKLLSKQQFTITVELQVTLMPLTCVQGHSQGGGDSAGRLEGTWKNGMHDVDVVQKSRIATTAPFASDKLKSQWQKLRITMIKAVGLKQLHAAGDSPWCRCEVLTTECTKGRRPTCRTKAQKKNLAPEWNESLELVGWHVGEELEFVVFSDGLLFSSEEGRARLASAAFYPEGFDGKLRLLGGKAVCAQLYVRVEGIT